MVELERMKVHNKKILKKRRKNLRNNMTHAEVLLWTYLKGKALDGLKFRRQHSIDNYILDFYCPEKKLAVEIDGPTHMTTKSINHDIQRTHVLSKHEIDQIRFSNEEIYDNILIVLQKIRERIKLM